IRRSAGHFGLDPAESKVGKIEFVDKNVDHPNLIVLTDPVFQAVGKQCALTAIPPFNEAPHLIPPHIAQESYSENHTDQRVFTQPGSDSDKSTTRICCPLSSKQPTSPDLTAPCPRRSCGPRRRPRASSAPACLRANPGRARAAAGP